MFRTPDFGRLALPHLDALYRTARRLCGRAVEAEDLVQETFLEAHRCHRSLREPERCRAWLFQIMRNLWFHRRQRAARAADVLTAHEAPEASASLEDEVLAGGFSDEVEHALRELPEELRTALLLVSVEEMTYEEVAQVMECPVGTVRSRVSRARTQMGAALPNARSASPRIATPSRVK